jgi:hypothetical protein
MGGNGTKTILIKVSSIFSLLTFELAFPHAWLFFETKHGPQSGKDTW